MPAPAPTNNNYSSPVDVVTTQQFMRGEFDNTVKRNVLLRELSARGNIKGDASGKFFERNARIGTFTSAVRADLDERTFNRKQQRVTWAVPYAWYETTGAIGDEDITFNRGQEALVQLNKVMLKNMGDDFRKDTCTYILRNNAGSNSTFGQAVANVSPVPIAGLPTMFGYGAAAQNYNADTQTTSGAIAATDKEALPNQVYFGVSTHPTNPIAGVDNKANESTSPVLTNWSSNAWGGGTTTWQANCIPAIDNTLNRLARSPDAMDSPDLLLMTRTMFSQLSVSIVSGGPSGLGSRVVFTEVSQNPNYRVYKDNMIPYGNTKGYWDEAMPANTCYVLNSNYLELDYFPVPAVNIGGTIEGNVNADNTEMFGVRTAYDIKQGGHLAVAILAGNLWGNPKFHGAIYNFA